jgi:hypothetical protein
VRSYSDFPAPIYITRQRWPDCDGNEFFRHIIIPYDQFNGISEARVSPVELYGLIWPGSVFNSDEHETSEISLELIMNLPSFNDSDVSAAELCIDVEETLFEGDVNELLLTPIHKLSIDSLSESFVSVVRLNLESAFVSIIVGEMGGADVGNIEPDSTNDFDISNIIFINNIIIPSVNTDSTISSALSFQNNIELDFVDSQNGNMTSSISYITLDVYPIPYDINDWQWWFFEINGPYW